MAGRKIKLCSYRDQEKEFHFLQGRHILAYCNQSFIVVYQAFSSEIADFAINNGQFGGQCFDFRRGTWLKTSFMMMMAISNWATLPGRERVLAILIRKELFEAILERAATGTRYTEDPCEVRAREVTLLWKHDYSIDDTLMMRSSLLIYIQPSFMATFNDEYIHDIYDVTDFVKNQLQLKQLGNYDDIEIPLETFFIPDDKHVANFIMLDSCGDKESLEGGAGNHTELIKHYNEIKKAVVVLQGSFNPVHKQHIEIMRISKDWVETNTEYTVVKGVMMVNTDKFLNKKFKKRNEKTIKIHHRLEMCKLAAEPYKWIHVLEMVEGGYSSQLLSFLGHRLSPPKCMVYYIFGADRALGVSHNSIEQSLFVGREGQTQRMIKRLQTDIADGKINRNSLNIVSGELPNISSTAIREYLEKIVHNKSESKQVSIADELVWRGWIDSCVGDYLVRCSSDLFIQ